MKKGSSPRAMVRRLRKKNIDEDENNRGTRTVWGNRVPPPPTPPTDTTTHTPSTPSLPSYPDNSITTAKYTILTFLPKNLFEQFRRLANFYFLCLAIIHSTIDSPVSPLTSILPLLFVITVTAVKQGYEDWLRHKEDNKVNNSPTRVIREGKVMEVYRRHVCVGEVVKVKEGEEFPCDLLLLTSDDPEAKCDVTTANLDGETNLKVGACLNRQQGYSEIRMEDSQEFYTSDSPILTAPEAPVVASHLISKTLTAYTGGGGHYLSATKRANVVSPEAVLALLCGYCGISTVGERVPDCQSDAGSYLMSVSRDARLHIV
ncbi:hypothetical protein Pmani_026815 [Petrolisthes manimaculis]|uniref:P-type phospholipid transporter n=1 Tax=Petrolisthes manimaculis TaxID=1843537 RepID=A0AAE1P3X8_9EUCA|nr:hypothetical protein Pmani_026815 [Petrolisthes manimaculis]